MRFWITKNSELPVREQLVRQVLLGILSEDLAPGHKLPSVRSVARRHQIHSNTVSAAYHDLLEQGWLELRRGSGLYVQPLHSPGGAASELDRMLAKLLQQANALGYEPADIRVRLDHLLRPRAYERILIAEPDAAMAEILQAEISGELNVPVEARTSPMEFDDLSRGIVVVLPTRAAAVKRKLAPDVFCVPLRLRSVRAALAAESKPRPDSIIAIASRSAEIRFWAHAMLIAVGIGPECLTEVDAALGGWQERLRLASIVVTDVVTARDLASGGIPRIFRVIADSSIAELRQLCGEPAL